MYAIYCRISQHILLAAMYSSGVAKPGPTRALARESAHLALASEIDDDHMINLYSLQSVV